MFLFTVLVFKLRMCLWVLTEMGCVRGVCGSPLGCILCIGSSRKLLAFEKTDRCAVNCVVSLTIIL